MIDAIVERDKGRFFYGTREAIFNLPFRTKQERVDFSRELMGEIIQANLGIRETPKRIYLEHEKDKIPYSDIGLSQALEETGNISMKIGTGELIFNLSSNFLNRPKIRKKNRGLHIMGFAIPNDLIKFNPSFIYELGKKYGKFVRGMGYEVSVKDYGEIEG